MAEVITVTALVPLLAASVWLAARGRMLRIVEDRRGIALQTVIIMVVLIAIAGGVATVLLTRGGSAVDDLEDTQVGRVASEFSNHQVCMAAGLTWSSASSHCWGGT